MRTLQEWIHRLLGTLRRGRPDEDLEEELRLHAQLAAEDAEHRGASARDGRRIARVRTGGVSQAMDALRDQRGLPWLDELTRDLRHGLRALRRSPSFTAVALLTLTLGIGANAAIYQLLDAIRIRELPVEDPEQLAIVELADVSRWRGRRTSGYPVLTNRLWEQLRDHQNVFSGMLAWANADLRLDRNIGARVARGLVVSGDFFAVLGVDAQLGRVLTRDDDRPGCGLPGAVVSDGFWRRYLGGDPAVIGRTLTLNARSVPVIGVTPARFSGIEVGRAFDVALPVCSQAAIGGEADWLVSGTTWWLTVIGRMAPGRQLSEVNQQLEAASPGIFRASLPPDYPPDQVKDYLGFGLRAVSGATGVSTLRNRYADPLVILQLITGIVLFIACTNLANLVLARASTREREFAVRLAVGGSWGRLARQLMVENGLLALGGAVAGLACAITLSRVLTTFLGQGLSLALPVDLRLIGVMLAMAVLSCLAFGLIPAWRASHVAAVDALKANARGSEASAAGTGLRRVLVVAQVACSLVLVVGGLLFAATLRNLLAVDVGFDPRGVAVTRVDFSRMSPGQARRTTLVNDVLEGIRRAPGVISAAEVRHVPFGGTGSTMFAQPVGSDAAAKAMVMINAMSADYLKTMGMRLIAGRDFDRRDTSMAPKVAIVNRLLARRLGLGDNPVGKRFLGQTSPSASEVYEVVGLVPESKYFGLREDPLSIAFVPIAQITDPRPFTDVMVRSSASIGELSSVLARAVAEVSPLVDADVRAFDSTIRDGLVRERLLAMLSGIFGALAALIAAVGLYGVMAYLVQRRTNEIGVRMALGAQRRDILTMVLGEAGTLLGIGLAIGAVAAFAAAGAAKSLVFGLQPHDIGIIGLACLLLGATAMVASSLPARRAASLQPLTALRDE